MKWSGFLFFSAKNLTTKYKNKHNRTILAVSLVAPCIRMPFILKVIFFVWWMIIFRWHLLLFACILRTNALWTFLVLKVAIKIIVKIARFSSFSPNFCYIWWFFRVLQHIWHSLLWKIIKYWKFLSENEENLPFITIT